MDATASIHFTCVRAEFIVRADMRAFAEKVQVVIGQPRSLRRKLPMYCLEVVIEIPSPSGPICENLHDVRRQAFRRPVRNSSSAPAIENGPSLSRSCA